jgi:hypothetical protein
MGLARAAAPALLNAITTLLERWNDTAQPAQRIEAHALRLFWIVEWALNARNNKRVRPARAQRRTFEVSTHHRKRSPKQDVIRMRRALLSGGFSGFGVAWVEASPTAQRIVLNGRRPTLNFLFDERAVLSRLDAALRDGALDHRPAEPEWDEVVHTLVPIFETLTGTTATLTIDPMSGRPASRVHEFALEAATAFG